MCNTSVSGILNMSGPFIYQENYKNLKQASESAWYEYTKIKVQNKTVKLLNDSMRVSISGFTPSYTFKFCLHAVPFISLGKKKK